MERKTLFNLSVAGNPLVQLPSDATAAKTLKRVFLEESTVANLPRWLEEATQVAVYAAGTPVCADPDVVAPQIECAYTRRNPFSSYFFPIERFRERYVL